MAKARRGERGAALIFALSMLAIFGIMGVAYVDYMNTNLVQSDLELRKARARLMAVSGIHIAAAGLREEVLSASHQVPKGVTTSFELPTYNGVTHGDDGIVAEPMNMTRVARATITVFDENGKVNLNHAPASALQKVLGVDGETARTIVTSLPRGAQGADARWFLTRDELLTRGLLTKAQYDQAAGAPLTTVTVIDHANPLGHFNVNGADPAALAAMLNLTLEQAQQVKDKGPFASIEALGQAITAVTGAPADAAASDPAIGLKSRCFRVVSQGFYARAAEQYRYDAATTPEEKEALLVKRITSTVEAVLLFQDDGTYEIIDWSTSPGAALPSASPSEPVPVEPGDAGTAVPVAVAESV
jgi:type II secretory pathway component PulK